MQKLTRRELAVIASASLATVTVIGRAQQPANNPDWYKAALESHKENSAILTKFQVPMSVEPAFQFKA